LLISDLYFMTSLGNSPAHDKILIRAIPIMIDSAQFKLIAQSMPILQSTEYILSDHLGSASITTNADGDKTSEVHYTPWGEVLDAWSASASLPMEYTFTGQMSYMDDPITSETTEGFGLMFFNARWLDPQLGRFAQADSIVPGGVQGLDRYAYVNNNPLRYTDPTGHTFKPPCPPVTITDISSLPKWLQMIIGIVTSPIGLVVDEGILRTQNAGESMMAFATGIPLGLGFTAGEKAVAPLADDALNAAKRLLDVGLDSKESDDLIRTLIDASTHNKGSSTVVLGSNPTYKNLAEVEGFTYFNMPDEVWNLLKPRPDIVRKINAGFLDDAISVSKSFVVKNDWWGDGLIYELRHLESKGVEWIKMK